MTRILRDQGAQNGCLVAGPQLDVDSALAQARAFPGLNGMDLARVVTTAEPYAAGVVAGTTCSRQPRSTSILRMLRLMPKS